MKLNHVEVQMLESLRRCRFLPGSYPKKLARDLDPENVSPLQRFYLYFFGYRYRKQIGNRVMEHYCATWLSKNKKPMSRRESEKLLRKALKAKDEPPTSTQIKIQV